MLLSLPVRQRRQRRLTRRTRQRPWSGTVGLIGLAPPTRPLQLTALLRRARLQALPARRTRYLLSRTVLQSRLLLPGPVLSGQAVLAAARLARPELPGLTDRPVRIHKARIGAAESALLVKHAPADELHRMHLSHKAGVARDHLRRD